jgi:hypothetical protein
VSRPRVAALLVLAAVLAACTGDDRRTEPDRAARPGRASTTTTTTAPAPGGTGRAYAPNAGFAHGFELVRRESPGAVDADLDLMAGTGARWLRVSIGWGHIERTPGVYEWAGTDHVVRGAVARGLSIVAVVTTAPAWDAVAGCSGFECAPEHPMRYADFVRVAAERYAPLGVRHWEIWNEPNHVRFWGPRPDPVAYTELLRRASVAIHDVDPAAIVLTGGLAPAPDDGHEISPLTFLRRVYELGGAPYFDAVAHHPYQYPEPPSFVHADNAFLQTERLHALMTSFGDGAKQIWGTEVGAPTRGGRSVSEREQAEWVREYYRRWNAWRFTGPLLWYTARDRGTRGTVEDSFGLVHHDRSPKPALAAFAELMHAPSPPLVRE